MKDQISRFMQEFPEAIQQTFAGNSFADFVRTEIPEELYNTGFVNREEYLVKGSVGQGNWATIPWIAILNLSITTTPQEGVYIVYLLSSDSKHLYLSFNQGCTKIKNSHMLLAAHHSLTFNSLDLHALILACHIGMAASRLTSQAFMCPSKFVEFSSFL